jgi:hypothetical protein
VLLERNELRLGECSDLEEVTAVDDEEGEGEMIVGIDEISNRCPATCRGRVDA